MAHCEEMVDDFTTLITCRSSVEIGRHFGFCRGKRRKLPGLMGVVHALSLVDFSFTSNGPCRGSEETETLQRVAAIIDLMT